MPNVKIPPSKHQEVVDKHVNDHRKPSDIARDYGVIECTIRHILKKHGAYVKRNSRYHPCNETYFDNIDTQEKAYFLGLMYADGCNQRNGLMMSLGEPDQYLLIALANAMGSPPRLYEPKKRKPFHKQKYMLSVHSNKVSLSLAKQGCVPAKSLILQFPTEQQVPTCLMSHFLRGVFDGDGSAYFSTDGKMIASITGSPDFCQGAAMFIETQLAVRPRITGYSHSKAKDIKLSTRGAIVFLDYIYHDSTIRMTRKYDKFITYLKGYQPVNVGGVAFPTETMIAIRDKWIKLAPCLP